MLTNRDIGLLRLVSQFVAVRKHASAVSVVRHLGAMQAQDYGGALTSVALRVDRGTRAMVEKALDDGEIVRSWPMRGTLHFVAAQDLRWVLRLTAPRAIAGASARQVSLGFDAAQFERARTVAIDVLRGGRRLPRAEFLAACAESGFDVEGPRGYHTTAHLAQIGVICLGPVRGNEQCVVLLDEWIPNPPDMERDEALGEWARRFFIGHGPATVADFARWAGLRTTDARVGLAAARSHLASIVVDGVELFLESSVLESLDDARRGARGTFLLPGFDEFILGYADRSSVLPTEFADRLVPGGNGMFKPTVVSDGAVVGTWRAIGAGQKRRVEATPFDAFTEKQLAAIADAFALLPR